jgi:ABC-2 type transport system permease protein
MVSFANGGGGDEAGTMASILAAINLRQHMDSFAAGIVDTRAVLLLLSLTALFLFLTLRVVESRRWK